MDKKCNITKKKGTINEMNIEAFKTHIKYITKRRLKPCFNIINNLASKVIKIYPREEKTQMKLVKPHNQQFIAEERAIKTFKNRFIAGLSIEEERFPTILWSYLIGQAHDPLNLLRASRFQPKLFA